MELKSSISSVSTSPFRITLFKHAPCQFNLHAPHVNSPKCSSIKLEVEQIGERPAMDVAASDMLFLLKNNWKTQHDVNQIHARLVTSGIIKDTSFTTKIILRLSSSPHPPLTEFARCLFFSHHSSLARENRDDPFLWNAVIKSHSHGLDPRQALFLFCFMIETGVLPDKFSFSLVLKACSRGGTAKEGKQIHGLLSKFETGCGFYLQNGLIWMYWQCGECESARQVFDRMPTKDSVSYNSMIDGYVKSGMFDSACKVFDEMPTGERNLITWNSMLSGCVQLEDGLNLAWKMFDEMPQRDLVSWNTMIDAFLKHGKIQEAENLFGAMPERDVVSWASMIHGYAKTGDISTARKLFDEMPHRDIVACNAIMAGYVRNGLHSDALDIFHHLTDLSPDTTTLSIVLSAIAQFGNLDKGIEIHDYIAEKGFCINGKLGVAVIDMYSKCGSIEKALSVFEMLEEKEVDHWNAMIGGLAIHGLGESAFHLFMEMERGSVLPDEITFIGLMTACGHSGLVKEGIIGFEVMRRVHKLDPRLQHYGCVVDMLGRAGFLEEAIKFIEGMPIQPNEVIWRTLLAACKVHGNYEIGKKVADHLIGLDSGNPNSYVLLSHIYSGLGLWGRASRTRTVMKQREMRKLPGCSWIELEGTVHEFSVQDQGHPRTEEIYSMLGGCCSWLSNQEVVLC